MTVKILEIPLSEYSVDSRPDYLEIGRRVDALIERNFPDGIYVERAIGLQDHKGITMDDLVGIILKSGTDKYDSERKSVLQEEFSGYDYDIQAGTILINNSHIINDEPGALPTFFGSIARHFYVDTLYDRGYAVRIDLILLYDSAALEVASKRNPSSRTVREGLEQFLFKFKFPEKKADALRGIIKILR